MKQTSGKSSWLVLYKDNHLLKIYFLIKLSKEFVVKYIYAP
ncbi:hypothetical protein [Helicobacter cetorum]|nr:hypothetical protein [Helicobacter cetorum]